VFGETQAALVAARATARQRPDDLSSAPTVDADDPDRVRFPMTIRWRGTTSGGAGRRSSPTAREVRYYVVIEVGESEGPQRKRVDEMVERRTRKRAGADPDDPLPGRIVNSMVGLA
jgi:hypothetical protein